MARAIAVFLVFLSTSAWADCLPRSADDTFAMVSAANRGQLADHLAQNRAIRCGNVRDYHRLREQQIQREQLEELKKLREEVERLRR